MLSGILREKLALNNCVPVFLHVSAGGRFGREFSGIALPYCWLLAAAAGIIPCAGENLDWIIGIASAVPCQKRGGDISARSRQSFGQDEATDVDSGRRVAKFRERILREAKLARNLT